jgi:superfamily II DNA or RNA helicase
VTPAALPAIAAPRAAAALLRHLLGAGGTGRDRLQAAAADAGFRLTPWQAEGAARLGRALERWGVALLADDVGLGKTFVALALVADARRRDERVLVLTPAALRAHWWSRLRGFGAGVAWRSFGRLSRDGADAPGDAFDLVVIDEAHGLRNPRTRRYAAAARLCAGARVLLLSATPVNNSLLDLYFQLRLGAGDATFADLGCACLRSAFDHAHRDPEAATPPALRRVLHAVSLRRTRRDVVAAMKDNALPDLRFPNGVRRRRVRYAFHLQDAGALRQACRLILRLRFDAFGGCLEPNSVRLLLRLMLLKRLESGTAALRATALTLRRGLQATADAAAQGVWLPPVRAAGNDEEQLGIAALLGGAAPPGVALPAVEATARRDLGLLDRLLATLPDDAADGKLARLEALLRRLGERPALLFTEYRASALAPHRRLATRGGVALITGREALLGGQPAGRGAVVARFAPLANGLPPPHPRERVRLLIATDVLSEGLNLHDAGVVIAWDRPWNPVRSRQRVGRIDRLGSAHDTVESFNFMPDRDLEVYLRLLERTRRKLAAIRRTEEAAGRGRASRRPATAALPPLDGTMDRLVRTLEEAVRTEDASASEVRKGVGLMDAGRGAGSGVIVALCDGGGARPRIVALDERGRALAWKDMLELLAGGLRAEPEVAPIDPARCATLLRLAAAATRGPHRRRTTPGGSARLGRRILACLATVRGGPDAARTARADRLLRGLAAGLDPAADHAAGRLARRRGLDFNALATAAEALLAGRDGRPGERSAASDAARIRVALVVV